VGGGRGPQRRREGIEEGRDEDADRDGDGLRAVAPGRDGGGRLVHRAHIRKDRFDRINGGIFDEPTLDTFMPHIALLNLGGEHKAIETGRSSEDMFERGDTGEQKAIKREIALEKITSLMLDIYPGQTEADKTGKRNLLREVFGTNSWTEISRLFSLDKLDEGIKNLELMVFKANEPKKVEAEKPAPTNGGSGKAKTKGAHA
jgi:hypothetical protein